MNRTVEKNKTLLVEGPASVSIISGKVQVFGFTIGNPKKVVIREGKQLPFAIEESTTFEISAGQNSRVEEIEGYTIPSSWTKAYEELGKIQAKPRTALVFGTIDSGKSSFCTYLINQLLQEKRKVAILDGDLGQSDIGPPCTVAYTIVTKPLTDLFNLKAKNAFFVGATSPSLASEKAIDGLAWLRSEITNDEPDFIIINTDGWTESECAVKYKIRLVEKLNPDIVFCIQQNDELAFLLNALRDCEKAVVTLEYPHAIKQRDKEKRRNLRELGYIKYLRNAKVQSLPLSWVKIDDNEMFGLSKPRGDLKRARKMYELLGMKPLHFAEMTDRVIVIIGRKRWIDSENLRKTEEFTKKNISIIRTGEEQGLLTALFGANKSFLGIGILQEIDYVRKTLKILTPIQGEVISIVIGKIKLDRNMKEVPVFEDENQIDFTSLRKLF